MRDFILGDMLPFHRMINEKRLRNHTNMLGCSQKVPKLLCRLDVTYSLQTGRATKGWFQTTWTYYLWYVCVFVFKHEPKTVAICTDCRVSKNNICIYVYLYIHIIQYICSDIFIDIYMCIMYICIYMYNYIHIQYIFSVPWLFV